MKGRDPFLAGRVTSSFASAWRSGLQLCGKLFCGSMFCSVCESWFQAAVCQQSWGRAVWSLQGRHVVGEWQGTLGPLEVNVAVSFSHQSSAISTQCREPTFSHWGLVHARPPKCGCRIVLFLASKQGLSLPAFLFSPTVQPLGRQLLSSVFWFKSSSLTQDSSTSSQRSPPPKYQRLPFYDTYWLPLIFLLWVEFSYYWSPLLSI